MEAICDCFRGILRTPETKVPQPRTREEKIRDSRARMSVSKDSTGATDHALIDAVRHPGDGVNPKLVPQSSFSTRPSTDDSEAAGYLAAVGLSSRHVIVMEAPDPAARLRRRVSNTSSNSVSPKVSPKASPSAASSTSCGLSPHQMRTSILRTPQPDEEASYSPAEHSAWSNVGVVPPPLKLPAQNMPPRSIGRVTRVDSINSAATTSPAHGYLDPTVSFNPSRRGSEEDHRPSVYHPIRPLTVLSTDDVVSFAAQRPGPRAARVDSTLREEEMALL